MKLKEKKNEEWRRERMRKKREAKKKSSRSNDRDFLAYNPIYMIIKSPNLMSISIFHNFTKP